MSALAEGEREKQLGLDLVESNNMAFVEAMRLRAFEIALEKGSVTTDDLHEWAESEGLEPGHPNAWGGIFRRGWQAVGFEQSRRAAAHARIIRRWVPRAGVEVS